MTSEQVGGVWPLIAGGGLPSTGAQMGLDFLSGGAFHADPIGWTLSGVAGVTNPNMMFFGAPGRGKSGTVKMFCLRMMAYGYRTLDARRRQGRIRATVPGARRRAARGRARSARADQPTRLRAAGQRLDPAPARRGAAPGRDGVLPLAGAHQGPGRLGSASRSPRPMRRAVGYVIRELTGYTTGADRMSEITIPQVWHALDNPSDDLVQECRYKDRQHFLDETRPMRDALGSLVKGHLAGLFDAPTTVKVDWRAPIQSLSLSRLDPLGDEAVGVALTCLNAGDGP